MHPASRARAMPTAMPAGHFPAGLRHGTGVSPERRHTKEKNGMKESGAMPMKGEGIGMEASPGHGRLERHHHTAEIIQIPLTVSHRVGTACFRRMRQHATRAFWHRQEYLPPGCACALQFFDSRTRHSHAHPARGSPATERQNAVMHFECPASPALCQEAVCAQHTGSIRHHPETYPRRKQQSTGSCGHYPPWGMVGIKFKVVMIENSLLR